MTAPVKITVARARKALVVLRITVSAEPGRVIPILNPRPCAALRG
jgi:hypothetical protein